MWLCVVFLMVFHCSQLWRRISASIHLSRSCTQRKKETWQLRVDLKQHLSQNSNGAKTVSRSARRVEVECTLCQTGISGLILSDRRTKAIIRASRKTLTVKTGRLADWSCYVSMLQGVFRCYRDFMKTSEVLKSLWTEYCILELWVYEFNTCWWYWYYCYYYCYHYSSSNCVSEPAATIERCGQRHSDSSLRGSRLPTTRSILRVDTQWPQTRLEDKSSPWA